MNINELRKKDHYSYSAFQCFLTCPMKYRFRYIDKIPSEKTSSCFPFGRAFHATLSRRAIEGKSFKHSDACDCFAQVFKVETDVTENLVYKKDENFESLLQQGFQMLSVALDNWQDDFAVKSVAEGFCIEVPGISKPMIGEFDLIVEDGSDEAVVDWKTSSSKWPVTKADFDLQASAFCYAYNKLHGRSPIFRFDVITKTKLPSCNSHYTIRTQDELDRFEYLAKAIDKNIQSGVFYPNDSCMNCAECPYADHCKKTTWRKLK